MQTVHELPVKNQAPPSPEISTQRKVGIEIVRSADLTSRFYHGPSRRFFPIVDENDSWARLVEKAL
jgi:hypothetical protein